MGFQHSHQSEHKRQGIVAALNSPATPGHLKPHLRKRLKEHDVKSFQGKPITGATPQMQPKQAFKPKSSRQAEQLLAKPPAPFANPNSGAQMPVAGAVKTRGSGNTAGKKGKSAFYGG